MVKCYELYITSFSSFLFIISFLVVRPHFSPEKRRGDEERRRLYRVVLNGLMPLTRKEGLNLLR